MTDSQLVQTLEGAGYAITGVPGPTDKLWIFEDDSLLGVVALFEKAEQLLGSWTEVNNWFLTSFSGALRLSPAKAWNAYAVFLAAEPVSTDIQRRFHAIENDVYGTRKICRGHVSRTGSLREALLPLLPLQSDFRLSSDDYVLRLKRRLSLSDDSVTALFGTSDADVLAKALMAER